jgi:hypothetical protein
MGIWECGNAGDIVSPCESKIRQQLQPEVNLVAFLNNDSPLRHEIPAGLGAACRAVVGRS